MEKVAIQLLVPALDISYEILIPNSLKVRQVINLLIELLGDLSRHTYVPSGTEMLCRRDTGNILAETCTFRDYSIKNGEELILL